VRTATKVLWAALGAALLARAARGEIASRPDPALRPPAPALPAESASEDEPTLEETQAAAIQLAAGDAGDDASRVTRARAAHWAPVLRGQLGGTTTTQSRDGTQDADPLQWNQLANASSWLVSATWDLPSAIYSRDETQLALTSVHLARVRREVAERAAELYASRTRCLLALRAQAQASATSQLEAALALLSVTADLDALTAGLFHPALARVQARVEALSRSLHLEAIP